MENLQIHTTVAEGLYDLSMLEEMDDNEYLLEMLTVLLKETPQGIKEMKEALQAGKVDIVCKKAHQLKSSAGVIQAQKLITLLDDIETSGKKGTAAHELQCMIADAALQYSNIEKTLKIYIEELK